MSIWELSDLCTPWCLHVVVTLRIAEHLAAGHAEIADLAATAAADAHSLHRVLRHLVSKGVFEEPERGKFILNDTARELLEPGIRLVLDLNGFGGRMAYPWSTLLSAVRTGTPAYREVFGREFWDDLAANPEIHAQFDDLMGPGHGVPDWRVLPRPADWRSIKTVVDVGGGTGSLLAEILREQPHVRGVLVDLPDTIARSAGVFRAAGVADRVTVSAQNFFDPLPGGANLYIVKNVLADWPDTEAKAILKRCAEAAKPSGRVIVFGSTGPGEEAPPELLMLVLVGGRGRTLDELSRLAGEAGLSFHETWRQESGKVLVEFRPDPASA
jgi:2,7-dihydroxy-5-methyl-1-naphthoate 7-O-methyltransferase